MIINNGVVLLGGRLQHRNSFLLIFDGPETYYHCRVTIDKLQAVENLLVEELHFLQALRQ